MESDASKSKLPTPDGESATLWAAPAKIEEAGWLSGRVGSLIRWLPCRGLCKRNCLCSMGADVQQYAPALGWQ